MSTSMLLAQGAPALTDAGLTDAGLTRLGAYLAGGIMLGGGAIGAAAGNGNLGAAVLAGTARQPAAQGRLTALSFTYVALVEAAYFINLAFMAVLIFAIAPG